MSSASHPAITWGSRIGDVAPSTTPVLARSASDALLAVTSSSGRRPRGGDRIRTGVHGFAGRCLATRPRRSWFNRSDYQMIR